MPRATSSAGSMPTCRSAWRCAAGSTASAGSASSSAARRCSSICSSGPASIRTGSATARCRAGSTEDGRWVPAAINFTAEAKPDQVGSGLRAINTLFHEGGHAAHFANVVQNSPCFSQEYAPTSMAYAETQSMFCDQLVDDADWMMRYARTPEGDADPGVAHPRPHRQQPADARLRRALDCRRPLLRVGAVPDVRERPHAGARAGAGARHRSAGCSASRARGRCSRFRTCSTRNPRRRTRATCSPTWRSRRRARISCASSDYLTDNPAIGPALSAHYWEPGNSVDHNRLLRSLTGEGFSARYLAGECTATVADATAEAETVDARRRDATISGRRGRVARGATSASCTATCSSPIHSDGEAAMCDRFESWIRAQYPV